MDMKPAKHLSFFLILAILVMASSTALAQEAIGTIINLQGKAWVESQSGKRDLKLKSPVHLHEEIVTGKDSKAEILLKDDSLLAQGPDSRIKVDDYIYDAEGRTLPSMLVKMGQGTFRVVTGKVAEQNPERFKMESPLAVIGIRGTMTGHVIAPERETHSALDLSGDHTVIVQSRLNPGSYQELTSDYDAVDVTRDGVSEVRRLSDQESRMLRRDTTPLGGGTGGRVEDGETENWTADEGQRPDTLLLAANDYGQQFALTTVNEIGPVQATPAAQTGSGPGSFSGIGESGAPNVFNLSNGASTVTVFDNRAATDMYTAMSVVPVQAGTTATPLTAGGGFYISELNIDGYTWGPGGGNGPAITQTQTGTYGGLGLSWGTWALPAGYTFATTNGGDTRYIQLTQGYYAFGNPSDLTGGAAFVGTISGTANGSYSVNGGAPGALPLGFFSANLTIQPGSGNDTMSGFFIQFGGANPITLQNPGPVAITSEGTFNVPFTNISTPLATHATASGAATGLVYISGVGAPGENQAAGVFNVTSPQEKISGNFSGSN